MHFSLPYVISQILNFLKLIYFYFLSQPSDLQLCKFMALRILTKPVLNFFVSISY